MAACRPAYFVLSKFNAGHLFKWIKVMASSINLRTVIFQSSDGVHKSYDFTYDG